jgi:hypothetical protein
LPNIWCLCNLNLSPTVIDAGEQHVAFSVADNNKVVAISAVYAATNYISRRKLWDDLNNLQTQFPLPWCFIGDFNVILGAHEHRGRVPPARLPMEEFKSWTDGFNLIHLHTSGADYTWQNGRGGLRHTEKRLDRAVCNQAWLDLCNVSAVSAITRHRSDHFPLLLEFQLHQVACASSFKFLRMWSMHSGCRGIIADSWSNMVDGG